MFIYVNPVSSLKQICLATIIIFTAFSCNTIVTDVDVPKAEKKIVFFGFMSNLDGEWKANVSLNRPLFDDNPNAEFDLVEDGQLVMRSGQESVDFEYKQGYYHTFNPLNQIPGAEYTITFNSPTYGTCTAKAIYQAPIEGLKVSMDSTEGKDGRTYKFVVEWKDQNNIEDFYLVQPYVTFKYDNNFYNTEMTEFMYLDDLIAEGGMCKKSFEFFVDEFEIDTIIGFYIAVSRIEKVHYRYGKALENYDPEFPFSEPSPLPSNITNGLGIFTLSNGEIINIR